ncbi:hypothetical protein JTB14_015789 [Gonioctena quinquepunctata]|nr:hypothetical protein JTB14_015789 [Gonioctena quinquepunctata]
MRAANSKTIIKLLEDNVFLLFGVPRTVIMNNGKPFANPWERQHCTVGVLLRSYIQNNHRHWDQVLQKAACALHESTGETPSSTTSAEKCVYMVKIMPYSIDYRMQSPARHWKTHQNIFGRFFRMSVIVKIRHSEKGGIDIISDIVIFNTKWKTKYGEKGTFNPKLNNIVRQNWLQGSSDLLLCIKKCLRVLMNYLMEKEIR